MCSGAEFPNLSELEARKGGGGGAFMCVWACVNLVASAHVSGTHVMLVATFTPAQHSRQCYREWGGVPLMCPGGQRPLSSSVPWPTGWRPLFWRVQNPTAADSLKKILEKHVAEKSILISMQFSMLLLPLLMWYFGQTMYSTERLTLICQFLFLERFVVVSLCLVISNSVKILDQWTSTFLVEISLVVIALDCNPKVFLKVHN